MTKAARLALLPIALIQAIAPGLFLLIPGFERIGSEAEIGLLRAPESPPGVFFAIWLPIFVGYLLSAVHALRSDTQLTQRLSVPLAMTGLLGTLWQLMTVAMGETLLAYPVLLALAGAAWWSAYRFDERRGTETGAPSLIADLTTGLYAGWMTLAVAISTTTTIRTITGLGTTDQVWPMLILALNIAVAAALVAFARITRSPWYVAALAWGLLGIIINTWALTGMNVGAVLTAVVAIWLLQRRFRLGAKGASA